MLQPRYPSLLSNVLAPAAASNNQALEAQIDAWVAALYGVALPATGVGA